MAKKIELGGFGVLHLNPIDIKDKEYETVDSTGNPLEHKMVGERARSVYVNKDGVEITNSQVCKKVIVDEETIIAPKLNPTSRVENEDIEVADDNSEIYNAIERKVYNVFTDSKKIKELVNENKVLKFPFVAGNGWKVYNAVLTAWGSKLILVGCRGNITEALNEFNDDTLELEIELVPQKETAKKLLRAVAYK